MSSRPFIEISNHFTVKRAQDKEKLKEGEKLKLQVEQLLEFKSRIMESQVRD